MTEQHTGAGGWLPAAVEIVRRFAWFPLAVLLCHEAAAHVFDLYRRWPPVDIPLHLAGGFATAFFCHGAIGALDRRGLIAVRGRPVRWLLTFALVCTAAVAWEFAEWTADHSIGTSCQVGLDDTMLDMFCGVVGGLSFILLSMTVSTTSCSLHPIRWLIVLAQLLAFWPLGPWYSRRLADGGGEEWGLLALATAVALAVREARTPAAAAPGGPALRRPPGLLWGALFTLLYAASYAWLPPLARACLAVTALAATVSACFLGRRFHPAIWGLLLLALPVVESLQFFAGYPLRTLVAALAAAWLRLGGLAVAPQGAALGWGNMLVAVDAPCSGIRMLWVGAYLVVALAGLYRLGFIRLLAAAGLSLAVLVLGNALRAAALFYLEAGLVPPVGGAHTAIGVATFGFTVAAIVAVLEFLRRTVKCAR